MIERVGRKKMQCPRDGADAQKSLLQGKQSRSYCSDICQVGDKEQFSWRKNGDNL